jgi:hypothetical protein
VVRLTHTGRTLMRYRTELAEQADEVSKPMIRLQESIYSDWVKRIERYGENGITRADANRLREITDRSILESVPEVKAWFHGEAPKAGLNGLRSQAAYIKKQLGVTDWTKLPSARIREAFITTEREIQTAASLGRTWPQGGVMSRFIDAETYRKTWTKNLQRAATGVQREIVTQIVKGGSWLDVSNSITDELGKLHISGQMSPEAFARGYARATLTRVANDASTGAAIDAGLDSFWNQGVPDDAQSDECAEASTYDAMTMDEWDASDVCPPPRHVMS